MINNDLIVSAYKLLLENNIPNSIASELVDKSLREYKQSNSSNIGFFVQLVHFNMDLFKQVQSRIEQSIRMKSRGKFNYTFNKG